MNKEREVVLSTTLSLLYLTLASCSHFTVKLFFLNSQQENRVDKPPQHWKLHGVLLTHAGLQFHVIF